MSKPPKGYDRFTGEERFKLVMAALARNDESDAAALSDSCPSFHYMAKDLNYCDRLRAQEKVMLTFCLSVTPFLNTLDMIEGFRPITGDYADLFAMCAFDSAVEAHWRAVDPGGQPETRSFDDPRAPSLDDIMSGYSGSVWTLAKRMDAMWDKARREALVALASSLEALERFADEQWGVSGEGAIEPMKELFEGLPRHQAALRQVSPNEGMVAYNHQALNAMWHLLCPAH
jgi:hypothetical protein